MTSPRASYPRHRVEAFSVGDVRERAFQVTPGDLARFADATGDRHPVHDDGAFARARGFPDVLVHGMLIASQCGGFIAEEFVGSHGLLVSMQSDFRLPVFCGEPLVWRAEVSRVDAAAMTVELTWRVFKPGGVVAQIGRGCAWLGTSA